MTEMALCKTCNIEKELNITNFKPRKGSKNGGFSYKCRECTNAYYREVDKNNPERRREKQRKYKEKYPDMILAKSLRFREKNKELGRTYEISEEAKVRKIERDKKRSKDPSPARVAWKRAEWRSYKKSALRQES